MVLVVVVVVVEPSPVREILNCRPAQLLLYKLAPPGNPPRLPDVVM